MNNDGTNSTKVGTKTDGVFRTVMNEISSRWDLMRQMTTPKAKDVNNECGYPDVLTTQDCKELYDREGPAARLVDIFPEECWKTNPIVFETEDEEHVTEFEKELEELVKRYKIWHYLERIDKMSGIGRYGILVIGVEGEEKETLAEPILTVPDDERDLEPTSKIKRRRLLYLKAFDETSVSIKQYEVNPMSPRFGYPALYSVKMVYRKTNTGDMGIESTESREVLIHWTRVLHVADNCLESDIFGKRRLQEVANRLYDIRKIAGGSGEMFWKGGFPGFATKTEPNVEYDAEAVKAEIQKYSLGLDRWLLLQGIEITPLQPQVSDPASHIRVQLMLAAMAKGIPYRIFMGTEEAQLAGSEDAKAWGRRCHKRNVKYVGPMIIEKFITRLIWMGVLPPPAPAKGFTVEFDNPDNLTEEEKAKVADLQTTAIAKYVASDAASFIPETEYMSIILGWPQSVIKQVMKSVEARLLEDGLDEEDDHNHDDDDDEDNKTEEEDEEDGDDGEEDGDRR